jgi:hypothetical protein
VVTAPSREVLENEVVPRLAAFLADRGLELSAAKTRIVHIDDGFDFLGFNIRRFPNGKLLVQPQKEKVSAHRRAPLDLPAQTGNDLAAVGPFGPEQPATTDSGRRPR